MLVTRPAVGIAPIEAVDNATAMTKTGQIMDTFVQHIHGILTPPSWMLQVRTHMSHFIFQGSDYCWDSARWTDHPMSLVKRLRIFVVQSWWFDFLLLSCPVIYLHFL